jgi:hypothetical protein
MELVDVGAGVKVSSRTELIMYRPSSYEIPQHLLKLKRVFEETMNNSNKKEK